jgi:hypothetical protein
MSSTVGHMKSATAVLVLLISLAVACAQAISSTPALELGNGAHPFYGDRTDLTTISPNSDGYRDAARIRYQAPSAGVASLDVMRADRKGVVFAEPAIPVAAGETFFTWAPPSSTPPGTYVVSVSAPGAKTARAVVRVQGIDAATGQAGYAQGEDAHVAVSTDAPRLQLDVIRVDATSWRTVGNDSVIGTRIGPTRTFPWRHTDRPHNISFHIGDWRSGVYFARLTAPDGRVGFAPFIVRPRHLGDARIAIVLPTLTWQAYNFYDRDGDGRGDTWYAGWRAHSTRLGRPFLHGGVPPHFRRYDLQFLIWAAEQHVAADYLTDTDLESIGSGKRLASLYDFVVFPGHHEYVTQREYDIVQGFRDRGGNLAWLSANNFFWKVVRHGPEIERVAEWRNLGRPEAALIGAQYRGNDEGERRGKMQPVAGAAPWLVDGTPLARGESWGDFGIEIDATAPSSPASTTVIAQIPNLYGPGFTAQMTYYETPAGAKVFAAGAFSLASAARTHVGRRLLDNLFAHLEQK